MYSESEPGKASRGILKLRIGEARIMRVLLFVEAHRDVEVADASVARWSWPTPILVIFLTETSTPSVS